MNQRIAVIAATKIDTEMGEEYLRRRGHVVGSYPLYEDSAEYEHMLSDVDEVRTQFELEIKQVLRNRFKKVFLYCNSLSAVVDLEAISEKYGVLITSPLEIYCNIAASKNSIAVMAGNSQGLSGIDRAIRFGNKACKVIGAALPTLVSDIELKQAPASCVTRNGLDKLLAFFKATGSECVVLGCTHFPYLREELTQLCDLQIIDPAEEMYRLITAADC